MSHVLYKGQVLSVDEEVLKELNLHSGQSVSEETFWKVLDLNCNLGIAKCKAAIKTTTLH